jgi:hypothetical protein
MANPFSGPRAKPRLWLYQWGGLLAARLPDMVAGGFTKACRGRLDAGSRAVASFGGDLTALREDEGP